MLICLEISNSDLARPDGPEVAFLKDSLLQLRLLKESLLYLRFLKECLLPLGFPKESSRIPCGLIRAQTPRFSLIDSLNNSGEILGGFLSFIMNGFRAVERSLVDSSRRPQVFVKDSPRKSYVMVLEVILKDCSRTPLVFGRILQRFLKDVEVF